MIKHKILLAEDEQALGTIIKESLETRGFEVLYCADGQAAKIAYQEQQPDLLVLDVMMPKKDGFTLVQEIRRQDPYIPIIFLTAKSRTEDIVEGFGYGANDYLKKPFSMEELIVRMMALLGRQQDKQHDKIVHIGKYIFDTEAQTLTLDQAKSMLTHREAQLLEALFRHQNKLTDRKEILIQLWGSDDFFNARSMDVFISKLRKKLADDPAVKILNVRGFGYKLVCQA
jgi:DNA-binding response OmpR family regulator